MGDLIWSFFFWKIPCWSSSEKVPQKWPASQRIQCSGLASASPKGQKHKGDWLQPSHGTGPPRTRSLLLVSQKCPHTFPNATWWLERCRWHLCSGGVRWEGPVCLFLSWCIVACKDGNICWFSSFLLLANQWEGSGSRTLHFCPQG